MSEERKKLIAEIGPTSSDFRKHSIYSRKASSLKKKGDEAAANI